MGPRLINRGRAAAAFGSHGWSGEAVPILERTLEGWKGLKAGGPVTARFAPASEDLARCRQMGADLAGAIRTR